MKTKTFLTVTLFTMMFTMSLTLFAFEDPETAYSGTRVMHTNFGSFTAKVYHVQGKDRMEMETGGQKMVTIIRRDKNVAWQLMPQMNMYMEMPVEIAESRDFSSGKLLEKTAVGEETINGHETTKYTIVFEGHDSSRGNGFFWMTKEEIPVKMLAHIQHEGELIKVEMEMTELNIGPQPDELFEVPSNYNKVGMPGRNIDLSKLPGQD